MRSRARRRPRSTRRHETCRGNDQVRRENALVVFCCCGNVGSREIEGPAIFSQQLVNGLMLGSIYAMVGVALTLSIGVLKFLHFNIPRPLMICGLAPPGV